MTTFDSTTQKDEFSLPTKRIVCPILVSDIFAAFPFPLFDFLIIEMIVYNEVLAHFVIQALVFEMSRSLNCPLQQSSNCGSNMQKFA